MTYLLLTVRFLDNRYHGLVARGGPPEWPPSPFRLFSALVAGVGRRGDLDTDVGRSLEWLQTLDPPIIIAPKGKEGQAITRFVPNNDGDKKFDRQERLAGKTSIPTLFVLDAKQTPEVHYVWNICNESQVPFDRIRDAARTLTTLGWGIDMAFADVRLASQAEVEALSSVRWHPKPNVWRDEGMLRVPTADEESQESTFDDLLHCHKTKMTRIERGKPLRTVDKPRVFEQVFYASVEQLIGRPCAVFTLQRDPPFRYPQPKLTHIAGMVRHLAKELMHMSPPDGVNNEWVKWYVLGHHHDRTEIHRQFSYLPLPSIGHAHADHAVRRVMVAAPAGDEAWLEHLARRLAGQQLKPEQGDEFGEDGPPTLIRIYQDKVADRYTAESNCWASVTPVILPGHDDHKQVKTRKLIEAALAQSGVDQPCTFQWSAHSRFPKALSAHKYDRNKRPIYFKPDYLRDLTAIHLTLTFNDELKVPGPLAIGAGRHCGFGLMAACD